MNNPTLFRTGIGFDAHQFAPGKKLILGGVHIPFECGLLGHSDADVVTHAIIDALLGAGSLGNIGSLYPDTDSRYKNIYSIEMLKDTYRLLVQHDIQIINIDAVIICDRPKIAPYADMIIATLSDACGGLPHSSLSIKGKTTEGMGFTGRGEGIASIATCLVYRTAQK